MFILLAVYLVYLLLYGLISYAIIYHLTRYSLEGDKSKLVLRGYITLSVVIILVTFLLIRPIG